MESSPDVISSLNRALEGRYRLEREVGAGGMATVYEAEDLRHARRVAIKVLRPDLTASMGAERFLREIEIAAQLQHPNILPLLDSGQVDGVVFYVMPYVDGPTLGARLRREGELPIQEAVRLLIGMLDALGHAHERGIVHRDVKPDNVMLSGRHALVADFGVARALSSASLATELTTVGVALGTPAYMAPEQAAADPHVDHRADLYAVGIVAYEMLTGRTPFPASTPQQLLAAHVTQIPTSVREHRPGVSHELDRIVMRCLEKRPANRWQSAREVIDHLEALGTPSGGMEPTSAQQPPASKSRRGAWIAGAIAMAGLVTVGLTLGLGVLSRTDAIPVLGQSSRVTSMRGLEVTPVISPDGSLLAYTAGTSARMRIYIQPVGGGRTITLSEDSTAFEYQPRWSPDGTRIMYLTREGAYVASSLGGVSRRIDRPSDSGVNRSSSSGQYIPDVTAAAWAPDGQRAFLARGGSMSIVAIDGGEETPVGDVPYELHSCAWSPTDERVACASGNHEGMIAGITYGNIAPSLVVLVDLATGSVRELTDRVTANGSPVWSPDGRRLFYLSNAQGSPDVYVLGIGRDGAGTGPAERVTTGLDATSISFSADGTRMAYDEFTARSGIWTLPIPRAAVSASTATRLTEGDEVIEAMRVSPDGRWLVYDSNLYGSSDIFRIPVAGGSAERITSSAVDEFAGSLSPDGSEVVYHTWRTGTRDIAIKRLDGDEMLLTETAKQESYPAFSPDGSAIAFQDQAVSDGVVGGVWVMRRGGDGEWSPPASVRVGGGPPAWLASDLLATTVEGRVELVSVSSGEVRVLYDPPPGAGHTSPHVVLPSDDGRSVYFKAHDREGAARIWSVPVVGGSPTLLVHWDDPLRPSARHDFAAGAGRFFFAIDERRSDIWVADVVYD